MDWYVDTTRAEAIAGVRAEVTAYLARHARDRAQVEDARMIVSELVGNVARHAPGPAWVSLVWSARRPTLTVYDLGPGYVPDPRLPDDQLSEGGRGLYIISRLTERIRGAARRAGGTSVSASLPVDRADEQDHDPPRHHAHALPALDEAAPGGGFGKEAFLRALVVQLAQSVEAENGPGAAQAAIAQVGADVGGQMEAEYRAACGVVGRMTPAQIADCYVRLKHAIDGDFYVIEASERRIVLGNRKCPFGEAVLRAPALCRMTSSVFGGIAARNSTHEASVVLEERIAVGDPGCRVVVHLDTAPEEPGIAHRYLTPRTPAPQSSGL